MSRSVTALVEPAVLRWARESCDLTALAAARKIGVDDDLVGQWESGQASPTIAQLKIAAAVYRRSLAVFFLPEPPATFDTLRDFRRLVGQVAGTWSVELHAEYRRALAQRDVLLELRELEDVESPTTWMIDAHGDDTAIGRRARAALLAHAPVALPAGSGDRYEHLNAWVAALEATGILVTTTESGRVSMQEMRAFSLYFDQIPVIVLNGQDAPRGRLFSLLHEYAHLALHTGGLCDMVTDRRATTPDRQLEARCNGIAAEILMPADAVIRHPDVVARAAAPESWDYPALAGAARAFGVSAEAMLRRLLTLGRTTQAFYESRREDFLRSYEADEARDRESGGNWYFNRARDLGKGFVREIAGARSRRVIDSTTAAEYLNVKVGQIDRLAQVASLRIGM